MLAVPRGLVACGLGLCALAACDLVPTSHRNAPPSAGAPDAAPPIDAPPDVSPPVGDGMPDLQFIATDMARSVTVTRSPFRDSDCEVVEQCVGGSGDRTLLRFDTVSANRGTADVFVGIPPEPGVSNDTFEWSPCHMHHHVRDYASYELLDATGVVLTARKQSFCLEDTQPIQPGVTSSNYSCLRQGITRGWADVYSRYLSCQWIDVTGLPSGAYTLRVVVNPKQKLPESNYDNNVFSVGVRF
jgi:hypothetical protein